MNSPEKFETLTDSPKHFIEAKTRGEIEAYISGRGKTRIHAGARNLSLNVSDDYGNRFLVELIQNAHDAHESGRHDGEIMTLEADFDDAETKSLLPLERLPASLKRGFAVLSREVPLLNSDGGNRPFRAFFVSAKLVREYDTGGVIRTLAGVTQSDVLDQTRLQALEWAFRLWSSGRSLAEKETRAANLWVPTRSGWCSAESAMFGDRPKTDISFNVAKSFFTRGSAKITCSR